MEVFSFIICRISINFVNIPPNLLFSFCPMISEIKLKIKKLGKSVNWSGCPKKFGGTTFYEISIAQDALSFMKQMVDQALGASRCSPLDQGNRWHSKSRQ